MKNPFIIAIFFCSFLLASCSCETTEDRLEDSPGMADQVGVTLDNPFKLTTEDLRSEKLEVEKDLNEIKNAKAERNAHDYKQFEPEIMMLESKMDSLNQIMNNFSSASESEKSEVYDRFKIMKEEIEEGIADIKKRFNDLKKLDT